MQLRRVQVKELGPWGSLEEFPWEDFLFSRFPKGKEEGEGEENQ